MLKVLSQRQKIILASVIAGFLLLLLLFSYGSQEQRSQGSTYGRTPSGYGGWYKYMQAQGIALQRWQKPPDQLSQQSQPMTLLRISATLLDRRLIDPSLVEWLKAGNRLVYLGGEAPVTPAPFRQVVTSDAGPVVIETRRRWPAKGDTLLADTYGALIQRERMGRGEEIWVVTPYLAANAYQDVAANFQLLAQLVQAPDQAIWVDEYMHGYKDAATLAQEVGQTVWAYLQKTPLLLLFLQGLIILVIAIWAGNQRFGPVMASRPPRLNNNLAYIEALATVLEKAECTDFVALHLKLKALDSEHSRLPRRNEVLAPLLSPMPKS